MAKVSLADRLAGQLADPPEVEVAPVAPEPAADGAEPPVAAPAAAPKARRPRKRAQAAPEQPAAPEPTLPRYLTLERVEGRLTLSQLDDLSALTRRLNRARGRGVGERITNNTLLRVGVSLLLANTDRLAGTTEEELRRSLGLTESQSPLDSDR